MTGDPKRERDGLDRLADALVEDILNSSDESILAEVTEEGSDPNKLTEEMRALFERTVQEGRKSKLVAAKKAVAEARENRPTVLNINSEERRRRYEAMIANDPDLSAKLTMAARNGEGQSERDIESALDDLAELGVFDNEPDDDA